MYKNFLEDPLSKLCLEVYLGDDDDIFEPKRNVNRRGAVSNRAKSKIISSFDRDDAPRKIDYLTADEWADDVVDFLSEHFNSAMGKDAIRQLAVAAAHKDKLIVKIGANSTLSVTEGFDVSKDFSSFSFKSKKEVYRGGRMGAWSDSARRAKLGDRDGQYITLMADEIFLRRLVKISPDAFYLIVGQKRKTQRLPRNLFLIFCSNDEYNKKFKPNLTLLNSTLEKIIQSNQGVAD